MSAIVFSCFSDAICAKNFWTNVFQMQSVEQFVWTFYFCFQVRASFEWKPEETEICRFDAGNVRPVQSGHIRIRINRPFTRRGFRHYSVSNFLTFVILTFLILLTFCVRVSFFYAAVKNYCFVSLAVLLIIIYKK